MIQLYKPYIAEDMNLNPIFKSGKLSSGIWGKKLEHLIGEFLNVEYINLVNNFTLAYHILFRHLDLRRGDQVALSPLACLESTMPVKSFGLEIVWVDIDPYTGTMSPESLHQALSENDIKVVLHNHFCGNPGHIDEIRDITRLHSAILIDDGIESFGSEYNQRKIGNDTADYSVFSLSYVRLPNCLQGAAIVSNKLENYQKIKVLTDNGIYRDSFRDTFGEINPRNDIVDIGYGATMSDINAYLGVKSMEEIRGLLEKQKENSELWARFINRYFPNSCTFGDEKRTPNYWVYGVISDKKDELKKFLTKNNFVTSSVHINNNIYSVFGKGNNVKNADAFVNKFLAIPCGWWVNSSDIIALLGEDVIK